MSRVKQICIKCKSQNDLAPADSARTHCDNVRTILCNLQCNTLDFFTFTKEMT